MKHQTTKSQYFVKETKREALWDAIFRELKKLEENIKENKKAREEAKRQYPLLFQH